MPKYTVAVTEIRHVPVVYMIEADDERDAVQKANIGDTIEEIGGHPGSGEVYERVVLTDAILVPDERETFAKSKGFESRAAMLDCVLPPIERLQPDYRGPGVEDAPDNWNC